MAGRADYKLPGEFVYDGMKFGWITNPGILDKVKIYPFNKEDVLISTYPRSGTRWLQEIVWLIMNDGKPSKIELDKRVPFIELDVPGTKGLELLKPGPNIIKTHLPFSYFKKAIAEKKPKVIVGMRNIRDQLVSFYHFYRMNDGLGNFSGTWEEFFELFKRKRLIYGDWLDFNFGWWTQRYLENVLILSYEDLKENPEKEIRRLAQFCGKEYSDDVISAIAQITTFRAMKDNPAVNYTNSKFQKHSISPFMRRGDVGDWENYFTPEQLAYLEEHYEVKLEAAGLKFRYKL